MRVISLFDGIACARQALSNVGAYIDEYISYEVDKKAREVAMKNWPGLENSWYGDVHDLIGGDCIDLLIGGSPCQDLSQLTRGAEGLKGKKSGLFYEYLRVLREVRPRYFLLENVRPQKKEWADLISKELGVEPVVINSRNFVQQNRVRYYWTNIPVAELSPEPDWEGRFRNANPYHNSYYEMKGGVAPALVAHNGKRGDRHRPQQWRVRVQNNRGADWHQMKGGVAPCLTANNGRKGAKDLPQRTVDGEWIPLTPEDCEVLQGLPVGYTEGVAKCHRYRTLGDGFTVPVIEHILRGMKDE